jgi:hypothetical protein
MDRASRFLWELQCGKKDRNLFRKAIRTLGKLIDQTKDISLITDGEPRYGNLLFDICYELLQTSKRERHRKTLKKGVKVRMKNKGSQFHKRGRKRSKYKAPCPEHPQTIQNIENKDYMPTTVRHSTVLFAVVTPLTAGRPTQTRKMKNPGREHWMSIG